MKLATLPYQLANKVRRLYWRIFGPETFGVRVVIHKHDDPNQILMLRHTYGNTGAWNISGGGYRPKKETPAEAARREVQEETGVTLTNLTPVGKHCTTGEGKQDVVSLFSATATNDYTNPHGEIAEIRWEDKQTVIDTYRVSHVAKNAINATLHS